MGHPNFVNVSVQCRCGHSVTWCVRIDRGVPEPLRCVPRGGGGAISEIRCQQCSHRCFASLGDFENAVRREVDRGWGRHIRAGVVTIEC